MCSTNTLRKLTLLQSSSPVSLLPSFPLSSLRTPPDIELNKLTQKQRDKLCEDLSILFCLWDFKDFYPKHSNRTDINNQEFLARRRALMTLLWSYYEHTAGNFVFVTFICLYLFCPYLFETGLDWDVKAKSVHKRAYSINIWLYNWPTNQVCIWASHSFSSNSWLQDQALLMALTQGSENSSKPEEEKQVLPPPIISFLLFLIS